MGQGHELVEPVCCWPWYIFDVLKCWCEPPGTPSISILLSSTTMQIWWVPWLLLTLRYENNKCFEHWNQSKLTHLRWILYIFVSMNDYSRPVPWYSTFWEVSFSDHQACKAKSISNNNLAKLHSDRGSTDLSTCSTPQRWAGCWRRFQHSHALK